MPKCKHCGVACDGEFHEAGCELEYGKHLKDCQDAGFEDVRCTPLDKPVANVEYVNEPQPQPHPQRSLKPEKQEKVKKRPGRPRKVVVDEA